VSGISLRSWNRGCLKDLFDLRVEGALANFRAVDEALAAGGHGCRVKVEAVVETVLTRTVVQTTARRQADRAAVEVLSAATADVASVLSDHVDVVEQCRKAAVDELRGHRHVAKQQTGEQVDHKTRTTRSKS